MRNAVMTFSQKMEGADVGLFFYAGHGIQISDRNYLIPTDAQLAHPRDVELALIELDTILKQMERETETRIIILDACRDNPLRETLAKLPVWIASGYWQRSFAVCWHARFRHLHRIRHETGSYRE